MKTWKSFYLLALAATLAFTGCKKDDEDEGASQTGKLTVGQTEYTLGAAEDRTAAVTFSATADWTAAVVYDDVESADWLTVTPASARPVNRASNCRPPAITGHRTARPTWISPAGISRCG